MTAVNGKNKLKSITHKNTNVWPQEIDVILLFWCNFQNSGQNKLRDRCLTWPNLQTQLAYNQFDQDENLNSILLFGAF